MARIDDSIIDGRHLERDRQGGPARGVDTYGSYAFGFLHVSKRPEAAVVVLCNEVLPFYQEFDLPVQAVLPDNGREFCGTERHPYERY